MLSSYGGVKVRAQLCEPADEKELAALLAEAKKRKLKVTFRAGGRAFDTQSLNRDLVVSLLRLDHVELDRERRRVTVGAGASWRKILAATAPHGLVPYIMVTSPNATAGGTISADSVSRFSPTCGKEGAHALSLRLLTLEGTVVTCSRTENQEIFRAVIAGLGYLGAVVEITYDLLPVPSAAPNLAVQTDFVPFSGLDHLATTLVPFVAEHRCTLDEIRGQIRPPIAVSAVVYMNKKRQGIVMRSSYVRCPPSELQGTVIHRPKNVFHLLLQVLALFDWGRRAGWWVTLNWTLKKRKTYVDTLDGYTFFQEGNELVKNWGRRLGFPLGIRQQTYIVPWDAANEDDSTNRLQNFLAEADRLLERRQLLPSIIDVLYIPEDTDQFLLSSSAVTPGFAVSIAFEHCFQRRFAKEEQALRDIATICFKNFQGRIHLAKHVFADPRLIERMYETTLPLMRRKKQELDPNHVLENEFMLRVLPALRS
jgi:decaprenylphospho-beta-D-ribofuranose 2-oxidase